MRVLLLSRYGCLGASSRLRSYQYIPYLTAQGVDVTIAPLLGDEYLKNLYEGRSKPWKAILLAYVRRLVCLLKVRNFDLIWIEYELLPWFPGWLETLLFSLDIPYIVDYDDAVFHRYDLHSKLIVRLLLSKKIDKVMRRAALVIVGNDYLANRARLGGATRIEYLPTVIDLERYHALPRGENKIFTIGWIGSPTTARYLHLIQPALAEICRDGIARLVLVGSGPIKLDSVPVETRAWTEDTEVTDIQSFDVGIMPLPDEPWERGKCGYKLIQYMACGRPIIASPVGINRKIVEEGVNGFLATTIAEWVAAFRVLYNNPELLERMGRYGRKRVETNYCIQVTAPRLLSLLRSVPKGLC